MVYISKAEKPFYVCLIGTAATGTVNTLYKVDNEAGLSVFGDENTGTLVKAAKVLLKYGARLVINRVTTGGDSAATEVNVIGTQNPNTGLELFRDTQGLLGVVPRLIVAPSFSSANVATKINDVATALGIVGIVDYIGTYANLVTARATSTGFGLKSKNLVITFPQVVKTATTEYLSAHLAGLWSAAAKYDQYGIFPNGKFLKEITSITPVITLSGATPNNQSLHDLGVVSVGQSGLNFTLFGYRNSLYSSANKSVDTLAIARIIEFEARSILTPILQQLSQTLLSGEATKQQIAQTLTAVLRDEASMGNLNGKSYAKFNSALSDDTSYVFDACLSPKGGLASGVLTVSLI